MDTGLGILAGAGFWILARVGLRILVGLACGLSLRLAWGF